MNASHASQKRIITLNMGLGRDSTAILCLLAEGRLTAKIDGKLQPVTPADITCAVFSDTGAEWRHSYEVQADISRMCRELHVPFLILAKPDAVALQTVKALMGATGGRPSLSRPATFGDVYRRAKAGAYHLRPDIMSDFASRSTVVSLSRGDCTENNKILPIRRLINDLSLIMFGKNNRQWARLVGSGAKLPHVTIIGIAADETSRLEYSGKRPTFVTEAYPLVDMGITKPAEAPILARHGLGHVKKSGCFMCPYQPLGWYWALSVTDHITWARVIAYEAKSTAKNPNMSINGAKKAGRIIPIAEQVATWRKLNPAATVETVLSKEYSRCQKEARAMIKSQRKLIQLAS